MKFFIQRSEFAKLKKLNEKKKKKKKIECQRGLKRKTINEANVSRRIGGNLHRGGKTKLALLTWNVPLNHRFELFSID